MAKTAYKNHIVGSRKGRVHEIYDNKGPDAATKWGVKNGLQKGTLKTWIAGFRREDAANEAARLAAEKKAERAARRAEKKAAKNADNNAAA